MRVLLFPLASGLILAGCGSPNDPGTGGVTRAEAEALNVAAQKLEQDAPPPSVTNQPQASPPLPPPLPEDND